MPKHDLMFILNAEGEPVVCPDVIEWAMWMEANYRARSVALEEFEDGSAVSTVFLGLNHNHFGGEPLLFETMVFIDWDGPDRETGTMRRYRNRDEAVAGHEEIVREVRTGIEESHADAADVIVRIMGWKKS
jgi:hypothetical protein